MIIYKTFITPVIFRSETNSRHLFFFTSINQMSNVQHRAKNISKLPLIDLTQNSTEIPFNDPRSPSANVSRYKIEKSGRVFR